MGVPVAGGVVVCIPRLEGRCVLQLLQVAEPACALRRTVEKAQPAASAHPGDHDVEGLQVQVRRERARRDAEDQLVQRLALELEVRNREGQGDGVLVAG